MRIIMCQETGDVLQLKEHILIDRAAFEKYIRSLRITADALWPVDRTVRKPPKIELTK